MKSFLKNILRLAFLAGVSGLALLSCRREELQEPDSGEIVLWVRDDMDFVSETKATAVTTLPSTLYWGATTGTSTETAKWSTASASTSSSKIYTGKYQTASPTAYNYYLASQSFTVGGDMTVANNGTDIVAGRLAQSTSTVPSVTLNHIFARTGSLTFNVPSGYTSSSVSWQIVGYSTVNGTAGTFNMKSQSWTAASTKLSSYTALTSSSDMYLIPGTYTVKISFVLTKGNFSKSYTQTGNVTLAGGKVNNIVATTNSDEAMQVVFTTSVTAWTSKTLSFDLGDGGSGGGGGSSSELGVFAGLNISSAPLYYNGSAYVIKDDDWNHTSWNSTYGKSSGSYYHNYVNLGQFFDSRGSSFSTYSGNINNAGSLVTYGDYNDWRMPTQADYQAIIGTSRAGSTINGTSGRRYAVIRLTGVSFAGTTTPAGLLLAPDGKTMTGISKTLSWNSVSYFSSNTGVTSAQLNEYLNQGCVFIPCGGDFYNSSWMNGGSAGPTLTATQSASSKCYYLDINGQQSILRVSDEVDKSSCYTMIYLVRTAGDSPASEPTYSLSNYTCNGTSSTRINTNQRLFNTTDYPNGFRLEFDGTATVNSSSLSYGLGGWFGCMSEAGSPYPGFVVRQDRNYSNSLEWGAGTSSGDSSIPNSFITCYSGTNVTIVITYNRSTLTMTVNGTVTSCTGSITHDFPLCIGGTMNTTTTWFSDRYGYVQINSLKVYKL